MGSTRATGTTSAFVNMAVTFNRSTDMWTLEYDCNSHPVVLVLNEDEMSMLLHLIGQASGAAAYARGMVQAVAAEWAELES